MTPREQNLFRTITLLTMLFRSNKRKVPTLSEQEQHTIIVTKEHLQNEQLPLSAFVNSLDLLDQKGYLMAHSILDQKEHMQLQETLSDENYRAAVKELEAEGQPQLSPELKESIFTVYKNAAPELGKEEKQEFIDQKITYQELIDLGRDTLINSTGDEVSYVVLLPFRNLETLYEKMADGQKFDDIQNASIWYDPNQKVLHANGKKIQTHYQAKANIEHDVFLLIPDSLDEGTVWFDDIPNRKAR